MRTALVAGVLLVFAGVAAGACGGSASTRSADAGAGSPSPADGGGLTDAQWADQGLAPDAGSTQDAAGGSDGSAIVSGDGGGAQSPSPSISIAVANASHTQFEDLGSCSSCNDLCTPVGTANSMAVLDLARKYLTSFFARLLLGDTSVGPLFQGEGIGSDEASGALTLTSKWGSARRLGAPRAPPRRMAHCASMLPSVTTDSSRCPRPPPLRMFENITAISLMPSWNAVVASGSAGKDQPVSLSSFVAPGPKVFGVVGWATPLTKKAKQSDPSRPRSSPVQDKKSRVWSAPGVWASH